MNEDRTAEIKLKPGDALLLVDIQNDFLPGGSLGVPNGNRVLAPLNLAIWIFHDKGFPILATRDWHPEKHCSFKPQGGPWPVHCVAGTRGAQFSSALNFPEEIRVISKATHEKFDAYSGFQETDMVQIIKKLEVRRLFIGGLATDYCVLNTVKDALHLGFQVVLIKNAIQAVNVYPNDGEKAIAEMKSLGAIMANSEDLN
ncbi:MAG: isochorismatase family protein [Nitrospiria bacterium]